MKIRINRTAIKFFVFGTFVATAVCVALLVYRVRQIDSAIAEIKQRQEPIACNEVSFSVENPIDDAKFYLSQAIPLKAAIFENEVNIESLQRPVDDEMIDQFDKVLTDYPKLFPLIKQACNASDTSANVSNPLGDHFEEEVSLIDIQQFGILLQWKAKLEIRKGDAIAAADSARQIAQLGNHVGRRPTGIMSLMCYSYQSEIAMDVMTEVLTSVPNDESKSNFVETIEELDPRDVYIKTLQAERVYAIAIAQASGLFVNGYFGADPINKYTNEIENYCASKQPDDDGNKIHSMQRIFKSSRARVDTLIAGIHQIKER